MPDALWLYDRLGTLNLFEGKPETWWPEYGTFEVLLGAVLTQNAQWSRVERSLQNLRSHGLDSPEALSTCDLETLQILIEPSGLFKSKSVYLKTLCEAIRARYGAFETFAAQVERDWLLAQKGIGPETADSILCYGCGRAVMVVDAYTHRLLRALGMEFETYDDLQAWFESAMASRFAEAQLPRLYARYHGMIVEYVKRHKGKGGVDVSILNQELT